MVSPLRRIQSCAQNCVTGQVQYGVVKNNMLRRALDEVGLKELDSVLEGTTSLATGAEDPIAPIRIISDYVKKMGKEKFHVKAAFMEGKVLGEAEIAQLATLSSKKDLQARLWAPCWPPSSAWLPFWLPSWSPRAAPCRGGSRSRITPFGPVFRALSRPAQV